jgi:hypothetical protein
MFRQRASRRGIRGSRQAKWRLGYGLKDLGSFKVPRHGIDGKRFEGLGKPKVSLGEPLEDLGDSKVPLGKVKSKGRLGKVMEISAI